VKTVGSIVRRLLKKRLWRLVGGRNPLLPTINLDPPARGDVDEDECGLQHGIGAGERLRAFRKEQAAPELAIARTCPLEVSEQHLCQA
jgi:hypothetical protein